MDSERRKTLEALIDMVDADDLSACWDSDHAESLLRSQSSAEELREIGADGELIERLWPEQQ